MAGDTPSLHYVLCNLGQNPMDFKLYIELASRAEGSDLLDLLRFPSDAAFRGGGEWAARWWAHGKTKRMHASQREKVLEKVAVEGFNELDLKWRPSDPMPLAALKVAAASLEVSLPDEQTLGASSNPPT